MKSELAKARDKWFLSEDGKECSKGTVWGQYLHNRLELAFLAGANFQSKRIEELEGYKEGARDCLKNAKERIVELENIPEYQVGKPILCPFQQHNEETDELWCGYDDEVNCDNDEFIPQGCPLLKSPIKIVIV